jgi:multisubunit Na+/H+ antiporter MnhB subunit
MIIITIVIVTMIITIIMFILITIIIQFDCYCNNYYYYAIKNITNSYNIYNVLLIESKELPRPHF